MIKNEYIEFHIEVKMLQMFFLFCLNTNLFLIIILKIILTWDKHVLYKQNEKKNNTLKNNIYITVYSTYVTNHKVYYGFSNYSNLWSISGAYFFTISFLWQTVFNVYYFFFTHLIRIFFSKVR